MATQDSMQKVKELFRGKTQQVFVAAMALLLLVQLLIFAMESSFTGGSLVQPEASANLKSAITPEKETFKSVHKMTKRWPSFRDSDYWVLASSNMFDPKMVLDAAKIEQRATQAYNEALAVFGQGDLNLAQQKVDEALSLRPGHDGAQKLRKKILQLQGKSDDVETTSTGKSAAAPPSAPKGK